MADSALPPRVDELNLNSTRFWASPTRERERAFELLRDERPVSFHPVRRDAAPPIGPGFWALTRHAHILEASRDASLWSSAKGAAIHDFPPGLAPFFQSMLNMDDPGHGRLRRIVSRGFTPAALGKLERAVRRRAAKVIDDVIDKGECDFVSEIAAPLPLLIICDMMGIPESEASLVLDQTVLLGGSDPEDFPPGADPLGLQIRAAETLTALMRELAAARLRAPREDLITWLLRADVDGEALSERELESFFVMLVVAGSETTQSAVGHGMKALCEHPDERRRWAADFEGTARTAVDEILRWATPVRYFRRTATRDAEIGGQLIGEGERVALWYESANRDARVFEDPYRFDVTRVPNEHVAFGGPGTHFCLGASLARREITVLFRELMLRLPDLEISGEPRMSRSQFMNRIKRMPCAFTPGGV